MQQPGRDLQENIEEKLGKTSHSIWTFQVTGPTLLHLTMWKWSSTFPSALALLPYKWRQPSEGWGKGGKLMLTEGPKRATHVLNFSSSVVKRSKMCHPGCKGGFHTLYFRQANSSLPTWRLMIIKKKSYNCWHYSYPSCTCSKIKKKKSLAAKYPLSEIYDVAIAQEWSL